MLNTLNLLLPSPSHHLAPFPFRECPEAPDTAISVPETENKGPDHSSYSQVVSPSKITWLILDAEHYIAGGENTYGSTIGEVSQVKGDARWHGDAGKDDSSTISLRLARSRSSCERAGGTFVESLLDQSKIRGRGGHGHGGNEDGSGAEHQPESLK
jgi:hypothetical protein